VAKANSSSPSPRTQSSSQHKTAKKTPSKKTKKPAIQSPAEEFKFTTSSSQANVALAMVGYMLERSFDEYCDTIAEFQDAPQFDLLVKESFGVSLKDYKGRDALLDFAVSCYEAGRLASKVKDMRRESGNYPRSMALEEEEAAGISSRPN
jgi:hypothetical protein